MVARAVPLTAGIARPAISLAATRKRLGNRVDGDQIYRRFLAHGLAYGPAFRGIAEVWASNGEALGRIAMPAAIEAEIGEYRIHPAILDACLQVTLAAIPDARDGGERTALRRPSSRARPIAYAFMVARVVSAGVTCR